MSDSRQFRQNADACEAMARASPFAKDREEFRRMAEHWLKMAREAEGGAQAPDGGSGHRDRGDRRS